LVVAAPNKAGFAERKLWNIEAASAATLVRLDVGRPNLPHFSMLVLMRMANSPGVLPIGSIPSGVRRSLISGSAMTRD
jgi:hypothetical protein